MNANYSKTSLRRWPTRRSPMEQWSLINNIIIIENNLSSSQDGKSAQGGLEQKRQKEININKFMVIIKLVTQKIMHSDDILLRGLFSYVGKSPDFKILNTEEEIYVKIARKF
ncbi:hypothetical protein BpHYR1_002546 [Brachionus plicatilis]|uniref:Uncharacterized protein n=1 Tax=Brachionus plicatilis TaxID=10195 RepID=A0A3M7QR62_BRAPC|nr:hypothetical protein BpHYR1_002546 [Brachionus plicatilis]